MLASAWLGVHLALMNSGQAMLASAWLVVAYPDHLLWLSFL